MRELLGYKLKQILLSRKNHWSPKTCPWTYHESREAGAWGVNIRLLVNHVMKWIGLSLSVGGFLLLGIASALYLFSSLGEASLYNAWGYSIYANFENATGLGPGVPVEIAGVRVGRVDTVQLTGSRAKVRLTIQNDIEIQDDAIASIQTKGLLGGPYLLISLGGSDNIIPPGGVLRETESPVDLPGLMAAYVASLKDAAGDSHSP